MHANSARAGLLDLDGCTVMDMLPRWANVILSLLQTLLTRAQHKAGGLVPLEQTGHGT